MASQFESNGRGRTSASEVVGQVDQAVRKEFDSNKRVLSFDEYLVLLGEQSVRQMRGSAQYMADMMDHFGKTQAKDPASGEAINGAFRFAIFDGDSGESASNRPVVGQESVQTELYRAFKTFSKLGINNRLLLLHGPNGSAKSSIIHSLMRGMERYSQTLEGAVYTFNWVFPSERLTRGGMGLSSGGNSSYGGMRETAPASFARLPDDEIMAKISCDLKDHPILLVPVGQRRALLESLLGREEAQRTWDSMPHSLRSGDLCARCKSIFESLLNSCSGDYRRVLAHAQVERFYFSRRYRKGLVTIEPQMHVDANYQQLTMNRSLGQLPPALQGLNLFSLSGDLVDGNRGLIEYSDLLKRPIDAFKYLLIACETGSVNVGPAIANFDSVMLGSGNELQLDAFKEFPDFTSFKARMELIRVPYLMTISEERRIYEPDLRQIAQEKHVAPHADWTLATWAVLTRLKKPNSINYPPSLSGIVSALTPIEKARLYDTGEMPMALGAEDRKLLRSSIRRLRDEYKSIPYYEGRLGASAREMKTVLYGAAQNSEFTCLSPLAVLRELEEFVKRVSEYEFLKQDVKDGYHDAVEFIATVRNEYLNRIDREVRDAIGLYDSRQWEEFLRKYVSHVALVLKKEKVKNAITGRLEEPDHSLIDEFEKIVEAPQGAAEKDAFRQNIISTVGAWSLDHAGEAVVYARVFPEHWQRLEKHYFEGQRALLTKMHNAVRLYGTDDPSITEEGSRLAQKTIVNMTEKQGYCEHCAREVIGFLMGSRY